jgi:hypothetical protein
LGSRDLADDGARSAGAARSAASTRLNRPGDRAGGPAPEPGQASTQRAVHDGIAHPETASPVRERDRPTGRIQGAGEVAEPVLPELRHFDPCLDRDHTRSRREVKPDCDRLLVAAHPSEEAASFDRDPLDGPR